MQTGSIVYVDHTKDGDVYYRVKLILEQQPQAEEPCRVCHRGALDFWGVIIQTGFLDDHYLTLARCDHCCGFTVFSYHEPAVNRLLPSEAECTDETIRP